MIMMSYQWHSYICVNKIDMLFYKSINADLISGIISLINTVLKQ